MTDHMPVQNRDGQPASQFGGDELTLIEPTLPLALGAQRYGDERIDVERIGQSLCRNTGKRRGQIALVAELEPQDGVAYGRLVGIAHEYMVDAPLLMAACGALVAMLKHSVALTTAPAR